MEDIGKNTIFILVVLTLLISAIGTWAILANLNFIGSKPSGESKKAEVELIQQNPVNDQTSASISLNILKPGVQNG